MHVQLQSKSPNPVGITNHFQKIFLHKNAERRLYPRALGDICSNVDLVAVFYKSKGKPKTKQKEKWTTMPNGKTVGKALCIAWASEEGARGKVTRFPFADVRCKKNAGNDSMDMIYLKWEFTDRKLLGLLFWLCDFDYSAEGEAQNMEKSNIGPHFCHFFLKFNVRRQKVIPKVACLYNFDIWQRPQVFWENPAEIGVLRETFELPLEKE